jgi:hypothetical protein
MPLRCPLRVMPAPPAGRTLPVWAGWPAEAVRWNVGAATALARDSPLSGTFGRCPSRHPDGGCVLDEEMCHMSWDAPRAIAAVAASVGFLALRAGVRIYLLSHSSR